MTEVRAAIYCRLSRAIDGDTTKVEDQERSCRETAARLGWEVHDAYIDNSITAWKRNVRRPQWERMLADVAAGAVNAIITYHGDRMVRQPRDLEKLIDLIEGKGILVASPTGTRNFNNRDDRAWARMVAAFAENEAAATSDRRKAQHARLRRQGKVRAGGRGGRAFGFATDGMTQVPAECELVREAAARVLAGEGIGAICRDWTARGVVTTTGIPFGHGTLRKLLARPRYAGLMPDGASPAAWLPVLSRETWELTRAVLDTRAAGFGYATNERKYLLSGIASCGACGARLRHNYSKGRGDRSYQQGYACAAPGCRKVWRDAALLEAYVQARVTARLANPLNPEPQAPAVPGLAAEFAALSAHLAEVDLTLADHTRGAVPALLARREGIVRRLAELRELAAGDAAARLLSAHAGITLEEFAALPLATRRALVSATFTVTVLPASKRGPGFRTEDVAMVPL